MTKEDVRNNESTIRLRSPGMASVLGARYPHSRQGYGGRGYINKIQYFSIILEKVGPDKIFACVALYQLCSSALDYIRIS